MYSLVALLIDIVVAERAALRMFMALVTNPI